MRQSSLNRQKRINRKADPEAISSTGGSGRPSFISSAVPGSSPQTEKTLFYIFANVCCHLLFHLRILRCQCDKRLTEIKEINEGDRNHEYEYE